MEVLGEKGQCPFALAQHTEKFWNVFFQNFRANALLQWCHHWRRALARNVWKKTFQNFPVCCAKANGWLFSPKSSSTDMNATRGISHHKAQKLNFFAITLFLCTSLLNMTKPEKFECLRVILLGAADLNPFSQSDKECTLCQGCSLEWWVLQQSCPLSDGVKRTVNCKLRTR